MRKLFLPIIVICGLFLINSCKKDSIGTNNGDNLPPGITPDLTTPVSAGVAGFITDENGAAVVDAVVKAGSITSTTDAYGHFRIPNASFAKSAGFVQVSKQGYFTGFRTFLPIEGKETFVRLQLITKTITGTINSSSGGTVSTAEGASITLLADAVVVANGNSPYTGAINVAAHWLDPSNTNVTLQTMPGDLRGIDESGYLQSLTTYGMIAVELSGSAGEPLQIAAGKKASLKVPIPSQLQADAPASIAIWYFEETNGLWKQDGTGTKSGTNYEAQVSHFTYWNWDFPSPSVNVTATLLNSSSQPLANIPVKISIDGNNNYNYRIYYTDTSGLIYCQLPGNVNYELNVLSVCGDAIYTRDFSTTNTDLNLGTVSIDPVPNSASLTATVLNCNNAPVQNGIIIMTDPNGVSQSAYFHNGTFNSALLFCDNPMSFVAFDLDSSQQSVSQSVNVVAGINDLGTIVACGPGLIQYCTLIIDGVPRPTDTPEWGAGMAEFVAPTRTQIIWANTGGLFVAQFDFHGAPAPGVHTGLSGYVFTNPPYAGYEAEINPVATVTITEYGPPITGFISGHFRAYFHDGLPTPLYDIECHFRFQGTN